MKNVWKMTPKERIKHAEIEVPRACKFLRRQMRRGWSIDDIFAQIYNSYGEFIYWELLESLDRVLNKKKIK